jgi:hypothetical protein
MEMIGKSVKEPQTSQEYSVDVNFGHPGSSGLKGWLNRGQTPLLCCI